MPDAPWQFTAALSPRPVVRVAGVDAYGQVLNEYTDQRRIDGTEPAQPWAVYLTDTEQRFRLLCFDLDAKSGNSAAAAARDADVLCGFLHDVGLDAVVCESGPTGGRHVWTALVEGVDAETVATLARLARHVCPSLDISPLSNAATGCVRPPGAPHRAGGRSTILSGSLYTLTAPTGTPEQVRRLVEVLAQRIDKAERTHDLNPQRPLPLDEHARLYLPGPRRELPAGSIAALREDAASGDASAVLWRVLIGAAAARWRHSDVAALVEDSPGLEHVRTYRDRNHRRPRSRADAARVLRRQWDKAVKHVASSPRQIGNDPTFDARADAIAERVRGVQGRADASVGRWSTGGGPADRRVLDGLCILALQALSATVEADIRRLALLVGVGRETARTALLRLSADGWIVQTREAVGSHGAHWTISPGLVIHTSDDTSRSQADPRPVGAGSAERLVLLSRLTLRVGDAAHDVFTLGPGLGHHAGNVYARTTTNPQGSEELARLTGDSPAHTVQTLDRLVAVGVLVRSRQGWCRHHTDQRVAAARRLNVDGRLDERARRYHIEREVWAWWQAEEAWMRAPHRSSAKYRPVRGQRVLLFDVGTHAHGPHPRRADGRLDWHEARRIVEQEHHDQANVDELLSERLRQGWRRRRTDYNVAAARLDKEENYRSRTPRAALRAVIDGRGAADSTAPMALIFSP